MAFRSVFLLALRCVQADESCLQEETTLLQTHGIGARSRTSMAKHIGEPVDPIPAGWTKVFENWNCGGSGSGSSFAEHGPAAANNEECAQACGAEGHIIAAFWHNSRDYCRCYDSCDAGGATLDTWPNTVMQMAPSVPVDPRFYGHSADGCPRVSGSGDLIATEAHYDPDTTASVRCCSMDGSSCSTDSLAGGCQAGKTLAEAHEICAANDMRLCTEHEMADNVCCNTGCMFDLHAVWVRPGFLGLTVDGCPTDNSNGADTSDDTHRWADHQAASDFSGDLIATEAHYDPDTTASVRCCSMDGSSCSTDSLAGGCQAGKTLAEAHEICAANDMRLCTEHEMADNVCCNTGCWFNHHAVWVTTLVGNED